MGFIRNGVDAGATVAYDYANVSNIRRDVYKTKKEIVKTPMVQELVAATFPGGFLPRTIWANREGLFARPYDEASHSYHPNGVTLYTPEVTFDYCFSAALLSIFMDLYPNAYEMNRVTTTELANGLQNGTWGVSLELKDEYREKQVSPAFDIFNIANTPVESLPLVLADAYTKKSGSMGKVSLVFGIVALILSLMGGLLIILSGLFAAGGCITAAISILTTEKGKKKDKKAIWGLILSIASWFLPVIISIFQISAIFGL